MLLLEPYLIKVNIEMTDVDSSPVTNKKTYEVAQ